MQNRNPYREMHTELDKIHKANQIDSSQDGSDAFEHFILSLAEVEDKPEDCRFGPFPGQPEYCFISFCMKADVLKNVLEQLLELNKIFPDLRVADVTNSMQKDNQQEFRGKPALSIWMKADAIRAHILPLFALFLGNNVEFLRQFQRFAYPSHLLHSSLHNIFEKEGMSTHDCDCIEDSLCQVVRESSERAKAIDLLTAKFFVNGIRNLIKGYLNATVFEDADVKALQPTQSRFQSENYRRPNENKFATEIYITAPKASANLVVRFFNQMRPGSSRLDEKTHRRPDVTPNELSRIVVDNQNLLHPGLLSDMQDVFKFAPHLTVDKYRIQSKTISCTTGELIGRLQTLCLKALGGSGDVLRQSLNDLYAHLVMHNYSDTDLLKTKLSEIEKNYQAVQTNSSKDFEPLLKELSKVINKNFAESKPSNAPRL